MSYQFNHSYMLYSSRYLRKIVMRFCSQGRLHLINKIFLKIVLFAKYFFKKFIILTFLYNRIRFMFPIFIKPVRKGRRYYSVPKYVPYNFQEKVSLDTFVSGVQFQKYAHSLFEQLLIELISVLKFSDSFSWKIVTQRMCLICKNRMYRHYRW